jgi:hypothetical protein
MPSEHGLGSCNRQRRRLLTARNRRKRRGAEAHWSGCVLPVLPLTGNRARPPGMTLTAILARGSALSPALPRFRGEWPLGDASIRTVGQFTLCERI